MSLRPSGDRTAAQITAAVRSFYDTDAERRDVQTKPGWKLEERAAFFDRLRAAEATTLLEVGAGTGQDSVFFAGQGLEVTAVDLAPVMIERIRAKGVHGLVRDVRELGFPDDSFDAVYAFNSLLHVPNADLAAALREIRAALKPGGLFYFGVYGGESAEGLSDDDRFFSFRTDRELLTYGKEVFEILDFHVLRNGASRFQSMTLVRP